MQGINNINETHDYMDSYNPLDSPALLNFAFCPAELLNLNEKVFYSNPLFKDKKENPLIESTVDFSIFDNFKKYIKYFYVCYSFELDGELYKNKSYFYFQVFYQAGIEQGSFDPFFGIFSEKEIVDFLRETDSFFNPDPHNKKLFDNIELATGSCHTLVQLMQHWTTVKLIEFNNEYLSTIKNMLAKNTFFEKEIFKKQTKEIKIKNKPKSKSKKPARTKIGKPAAAKRNTNEQTENKPKLKRTKKTNQKKPNQS